MIVQRIIFWLCVLAVFHTYLFYPLLLKIFSIGRTTNKIFFENTDEFPKVSILIAAHNEEALISEKIESVFSGAFPTEKIEVLVGSDNSTDQTNEILKNLQGKYERIKLIEFTSRTGKVKIINDLSKKAIHEILIITDANVIFDNSTLLELTKHFKNPSIALIDTNMINKGLKKEGISVQEKTYIESEVFIKNAESKIWGTMMGPFGGCYAVRKNHFFDVPENFLVDDFYVNMKVLEKGGKCINEVNAKVYEDVSNNLADEFRRKIRIATGSFQNLFTFFHLLFKFNGLSFSFFSHKVLRWVGPLFMITALAFIFPLIKFNELYYWILIGGLGLVALPFLDILLKKINIHLSFLRFATHFFTMNLALLIGLFKFIGGVKSSVWQPTKRNQ